MDDDIPLKLQGDHLFRLGVLVHLDSVIIDIDGERSGLMGPILTSVFEQRVIMLCPAGVLF